MLKERIQQYIENNKGPVFELEKEYIEKHPVGTENILFDENGANRFKNAYIERCDKETEELIAQENVLFLNEPVQYLKKHKNEFLYVESEWFELVNVDAVALEADDVFGTYDVMLGLKLQKKFQKTVKNYCNQQLQGSDPMFDLLFNQEEGLWNLNFALNYVPEFKEDLSIGEAFSLIYQFLFHLQVNVEEQGVL